MAAAGAHPTGERKYPPARPTGTVAMRRLRAPDCRQP